jgi:5'(3')-deoxyribonucleotidase
MLPTPLVHIDCDGVMGDFVQSDLAFIERQTGLKYTPEDVTDWDVLKTFGLKHLEPVFNDEINHRNFCLDLPVFPGTKEALKELRSMATVVCLTAPHGAAMWPHHRRVWLQERLGFDKHHIIQADSKFMVYGNVFVDDRFDNLVDWKSWWRDEDALLWDRPYNRTSNSQSISRISSWDEVIAVVERRVGKR